MRRRRISRVAGIALVVFAGVAAGAGAYWTGSGSGNGGAAPADQTAITLTPGTPTGQLRPGGAAQVAVVATNQNLHAVRIGSLSLDTGAGTAGFDVDAGHSACTGHALAFSTQTNGGAGWTVPARVGMTDGTLTIQLPGALTMGTSAANACQGASFTVHLRGAL